VKKALHLWVREVTNHKEIGFHKILTRKNKATPWFLNFIPTFATQAEGGLNIYHAHFLFRVKEAE